MGYTLADLAQRVIDDKLDDISFDTTIVSRFINDTQRDIFNTYELPFNEKAYIGLMPIGECLFKMPNDCQLVQAAVITNPDGSQKDIMPGFLDFRTFVSRFKTPYQEVASEVRFWTLYAKQIYTSAPIDKAYSLELFYIKKPIELIDGADIPEIPEEFGELLVLGAFRRVLERNEDYDLASVINGQYGTLLDKMVARYGYRMAAGPIKLKMPNRGQVRRS